MQFGLIISALMHAALLGWAFITIQTQRDMRMPEPDPIITGLVSESELTKLKQGAREAKLLQALNKEQPKTEPAKKEAAKPKPVAAAPPPPPPPEPPAVKPEAKSDPIAEKLAQPPPPTPAAEEQKRREAMLKEQELKAKADEQQRQAALKEQARQAEEKAKEAEALQRAEEQRLEAQRRAEEQRKAEEAKRLAEEQKRADEQKRAEEQRRQAELKKKREDEQRRREAAQKRKQEEDRKRQEAEAAKQKQFDAAKIAALLNKVPDKGAPPPSAPPNEPTKNKGPTLGAPEGKDTQISASEVAMLKGIISSRLRSCWRLPSGGGGSDTPVVTLRWNLNPDGTLDREPVVEQPRGDALFRLAAEAAVRAVQQCAPFPLPRDKYVHWKSITWEFDPSRMM